MDAEFWKAVLVQSAGLAGVVATVAILYVVFKYGVPALQHKPGGNGSGGKKAEPETARIADCLEKLTACLADIQDKIGDLHTWHNVTDDDGVRVWYIRKSMLAVLERMRETEEKVADALRQLTYITTQIREQNDRIERQMERVGERLDRPHSP